LPNSIKTHPVMVFTGAKFVDEIMKHLEKKYESTCIIWLF